MSTWTNVDKGVGLPSIFYNDPILYNNTAYFYNGKATSVWSNPNKTSTTFANINKSSAPSWSNQSKN